MPSLRLGRAFGCCRNGNRKRSVPLRKRQHHHFLRRPKSRPRRPRSLHAVGQTDVLQSNNQAIEQSNNSNSACGRHSSHFDRDSGASESDNTHRARIHPPEYPPTVRRSGNRRRAREVLRRPRLRANVRGRPREGFRGLLGRRMVRAPPPGSASSYSRFLRSVQVVNVRRFLTGRRSGRRARRRTDPCRDWRSPGAPRCRVRSRAPS